MSEGAWETEDHNGDRSTKTGALLVIPTRKADALLIAHFRSTAASSAEAEQAIQALRERDIIKNAGCQGGNRRCGGDRHNGDAE